ncbi:MAG: hypothetical protein QOJ35_1380 [Solirubrobacteraceae bacterium]|jgi:hypothetical protein|nr:hypothetical protein [Solirubrobacteraceae bacterium]
MISMRSRAAGAVALATLVACAAPTRAVAAGEPQITAAGIDAGDHFAVTWTLAPGTTFDEIDFSSSSILDPLLDYEDFADLDNFAGFECAPPPAFCGGTSTQTSYVDGDREPRDRRYHVIVVARAGDRRLTSPVWVIDETKPLIPGEGRPSDVATNTPVAGHEYVAPAPDTIPAPALSLPAPTRRTIGAFLQRGIRARLACPLFECYARVVLQLGSTDLALDDRTVRPDGRHTFVLRPATRKLRSRLRGRTRAHLKLSVAVSQPGGKETPIVRKIDLRR